MPIMSNTGVKRQAKRVNILKTVLVAFGGLTVLDLVGVLILHRSAPGDRARQHRRAAYAEWAERQARLDSLDHTSV